MFSFSELFQSAHVLALAVAIIIFLVTIFLVVKRWIGFYIALLLLVLSVIAGLIINYKSDLHHYASSSDTSISVSSEKAGETSFTKQMKQAIEDLKTELEAEKKNLVSVMNDVQEIFDSMDTQKQKLDDFIVEARVQFKKDAPVQLPQTSVETTQKNL